MLSHGRLMIQDGSWISLHAQADHVGESKEATVGGSHLLLGVLEVVKCDGWATRKNLSELRLQRAQRLLKEGWRAQKAVEDEPVSFKTLRVGTQETQIGESNPVVLGMKKQDTIRARHRVVVELGRVAKERWTRDVDSERLID